MKRHLLTILLVVIVLCLRGGISAESVGEGHASTFAVWLPCAVCAVRGKKGGAGFPR